MLFKIISSLYCRWHLLNSKLDCSQMGFLPLLPLTEGGEVEQGREGPSEIPLCVGLESFCLCELNIKQSWAAAGSLKWQRGGIRPEYRPLPQHVPVQNGLRRSTKTAQLKVFWEWHKIKAMDLSLCYHSCHIMNALKNHYSVMLHTVIELPLSHLSSRLKFVFFIEKPSGFDVFQA